MVDYVTSRIKRSKATGLDEISSDHQNIFYSSIQLSHLSSLDILEVSITTCPIISKVFKNWLIWRFYSFLLSSDHQLGFKKGSSCTYTIYSFHKIVNYYTINGSTASVCTVGLSKAFDSLPFCVAGKTYEQEIFQSIYLCFLNIGLIIKPHFWPG